MDKKPLAEKAPASTGQTPPTDPGDAAEGWNPYDEYDTRTEAETPKQTPEYIENTMPWLKDAIAKRQAEKNAHPLPAAKKPAPPKS